MIDNTNSAEQKSIFADVDMNKLFIEAINNSSSENAESPNSAYLDESDTLQYTK